MIHSIRTISSHLRKGKFSALAAVLVIAVLALAVTEKAGFLNGHKAVTLHTTLDAVEPSMFTAKKPNEKYVIDVRTPRKIRLGLWIENLEGQKVYECKHRKARRSHCIAFTLPKVGNYTIHLERTRPLFGVSTRRSDSSISAKIDVFTEDRRVVEPFLASWGL